MAKKILGSEKQQTGRNRRKNVSFKRLAGKVIDVVKKTLTRKKQDSAEQKKTKPFGGRGGRKRKLTAEEIEKENVELRIKAIENESVESGSGNDATSVFGSFFYTNDKFINQFEDGEMLETIKKKYPLFDPQKYDESKLRKQVLYMLGDSKFIGELFERYSINIFDFFKFLYRTEPSIFSGMFIQKIQAAIKRKKYASVKQHKYRFQKQRQKPKRAKARGF